MVQGWEPYDISDIFYELAMTVSMIMITTIDDMQVVMKEGGPRDGPGTGTSERGHISRLALGDEAGPSEARKKEMLPH